MRIQNPRKATDDDFCSLGMLLFLRSGGDIKVPWEEIEKLTEEHEGDHENVAYCEIVEGSHVRFFSKRG